MEPKTLSSHKNFPEYSCNNANFKYAPSRNPYASRLLKFKALLDQDTESHRGHWRQKLANNRLDPQKELHVEIGCNAGHVITGWALRNPEVYYIGIDWKYKAIYRASEKAQKQGLQNILFLRAYGERLKYIFGPQEINHLYILFPDPWPKTRQKKNRLIQQERMALFSDLVIPGGTLTFRTDHDDYFESIYKTALNSHENWTVMDITRNLHEHNPRAKELVPPDVTLFEKIFIQKGLTIKSLKLRRV